MAEIQITLDDIEEIQKGVSYKVPSHSKDHFHVVTSLGRDQYKCNCEYKGVDHCHHVLRVMLLKHHVQIQILEDKIHHKMTEIDFQDFVEKQDTIEENVRTILDLHEETRNSDMTLCMTYWSMFDKLKVEEGFLHIPRAIHTLTKFESISRARRKIQNTQGLYPPTDEEVAKRRKLLEQFHRDYYREE